MTTMTYLRPSAAELFVLVEEVEDAAAAVTRLELVARLRKLVEAFDEMFTHELVGLLDEGATPQQVAAAIGMTPQGVSNRVDRFNGRQAEPTELVPIDGGKVRRARLRLGLGSREFAGQLGMSPSRLSKIEHGHLTAVSAQACRQLEEALGVKLNRRRR